MPYFVISNFASGRDLRRAAETAPSGSVRVLRNAFINEGGEIEKRKAFVNQSDLTAYGQTAGFKGRITGPFPSPNDDKTVFFRHRSTTAPGSPFTGTGTARYVQNIEAATNRVQQRFWVQPSALTLPATSALLHGASYSQYSTNGYVVESYVEQGTLARRYQHVYVGFTSGEPTSEAAVTANADRAYQRVLRGKGYVVSGDTLYGSAVGDPSDMAGTGAWTTDLTNQGTPIGRGVALGDYFGQLVAFGTQGMMFWAVDPDPAQNQYLRTVQGSVFGPRTVTGYGDNDLMYLSRSGIRSLQARDSSNLARVGDVGSPIDRDLRDKLKPDAIDTDPLFGSVSPEVSNALFYDLAHGIVHQDSGQFWLALRDEIHVLSRYPSSRVLAWSTYDLPSPTYATELSGERKAGWVADWCNINETVVLRNFADEVYLYGGAEGDEYDASEVEVVLPFMTMDRPGSDKLFTGLDIVCDGDWEIQFSTVDPGEDRDIQWDSLSRTSDSSRSGQRIWFEARGTQIALRLTTRDPRAAKISEILIHYKDGAHK